MSYFKIRLLSFILVLFSFSFVHTRKLEDFDFGSIQLETNEPAKAEVKVGNGVLNTIQAENETIIGEKTDKPKKANHHKSGRKLKERRCKRGEFFHIRGRACVPIECLGIRDNDSGNCGDTHGAVRVHNGFYRTSAGGGGTSWHNKAQHTGMRFSGISRGGKKG